MIRIIVGAALLLASGAASATPYEDALAAHDRGDHAKAFSIMKPLAEGGDVAAEFNIGLAYANALGVERNDRLAVEWLRKAANAGYHQAEVVLGLMTKFGRGVPADSKAAATWFTKAADGGDPNAQFLLGVAVMEGQGVERDQKRAVGLFKKAAEQGFTQAQISLGAAYADGSGADRDLSASYMWLTVASKDMPSGRARELTVGLRDEIAKQMEPDDIKTAERMAAAFTPKASPK